MVKPIPKARLQFVLFDILVRPPHVLRRMCSAACAYAVLQRSGTTVCRATTCTIASACSVCESSGRCTSTRTRFVAAFSKATSHSIAMSRYGQSLTA